MPARARSMMRSLAAPRVRAALLRLAARASLAAEVSSPAEVLPDTEATYVT
eukprot:COSAG05_NODE_1334_length_5151_cov_3.207641_2_plen_51_part_00